MESPQPIPTLDTGTGTLADAIRQRQRVYTSAEAARELSVTRDAILRAIHRGTLKAHRANRDPRGAVSIWHIRPDDLADYDERRRTPLNQKWGNRGLEVSATGTGR